MFGGGRIIVNTINIESEGTPDMLDNMYGMIKDKKNRGDYEQIELYIISKVLSWGKYITNLNFQKSYYKWFYTNCCYYDTYNHHNSRNRNRIRNYESYTVRSKFFIDPAGIISLLTIMYFYADIRYLGIIIKDYRDIAKQFIEAQCLRQDHTSNQDSTHSFRLAYDVEGLITKFEIGMDSRVIVEDTPEEHKQRARHLKTLLETSKKAHPSFILPIPPPIPPTPRPPVAAASASAAIKVEQPPNDNPRVALGEMAEGKKKRLLFKNIKIKIPKKLSRAFTRFKRMKNRRTTRKISRRNNKRR